MHLRQSLSSPLSNLPRWIQACGLATQSAVTGIAVTGIAITSVFTVVPAAWGQINPDATLGAERSILNPNVTVGGALGDRIDGGALRGSNLFHSFQDFNVQELQRVYFSNPNGIENIISRVTGQTGSDIMGTLGVDGAANLFLINPNGVVFGPNATLDISGSFITGTADEVTFSDGYAFSATNPNAPPLVTVNIPIGLQHGQDPPAMVASQADLTVGQDLTLSGGSVTSTGHLSATQGQVKVEGVTGDVQVQDVTAQSALLTAQADLFLQESQLQTTGDLTLQAGQEVYIRDSETNSFLAQAGGNLLVQGNEQIDILALNHPQTPFQSGGDLTLMSDGDISGDAHFQSGGDFSILDLSGGPGRFVSFYDPIINVAGDSALGDYNGVALKVVAGGNITAGSIEITGPDDPGNIPAADPDFVALTTTPALILNAGGDVTIDPTFSANGNSFIRTSTVDGTDAGDVRITAGGQIAIENSFINTTVRGQAGDGGRAGSVILTSNSNAATINDPAISLINTGIDAAAFTDNGRSGSVTIQAANGAVALNGNSTIFTDTFADADAAANLPTGGNILIEGTDVSVTDYRLDARVRNNAQGNGGNIRIRSTNGGNVALDDVAITTEVQADASGDAGSIFVGDISSLFGNGPTDTINITNSQITTQAQPGSAGDPGLVVIGANDAVDISGSNITASVAGASTTGSSGGDPNQGSAAVYIDGGQLGITNTTIQNDTSAVADGGSVFLGIFNADSIALDGTTVSSTADDAGDAGNISIGRTTTADVQLMGGTEVSTITTGEGAGGDIRIQGQSIGIAGQSLVEAGTDGPGNSGRVTVAAAGSSVTLDNSEIRTSSISGDADAGTAGNIDITAIADVTLANGAEVRAETNAGGSENDGNVTIASNDLTVNNSLISTSTESGIAGNILLNNIPGSISLNGTLPGEPLGGLFAGSAESGVGGDLIVDTGVLTIANGAGASVSATGNGVPGNLSVRATSLVLSNGGILEANTETSTEQSEVSLFILDNLVLRDSSISASTQSGQAGELRLDVRNSILVEDTNPNDTIDSGIFAEATAGGGAGNLTLISPQITVQGQGAQAAVNSQGSGPAGNLTVQANNILVQNGGGLQADSTDSTQGGNVTLTGITDSAQNAPQALATVRVEDSLVSASTQTGVAGRVSVTATDSVFVSGTYEAGPAGIAAAATEGGNAGNLLVRTNALTVENGAAVAVSSAGVQPDGTSGNAGNVDIFANTVAVNSNGQISAETEGGGSDTTGNITLQNLSTLTVENGLISASTDTGVAGSVRVNAADGVFLSGEVSPNILAPDEDGVSRAGILAQATGVGGRAGNVTVNTGGLLRVQDEAQIAVSSPGGPAGNLGVTAAAINLNQGNLRALSGQGNTGGNITITLEDSTTLSNVLRLENESEISAEGRNDARGGNIDITSDFIFAFFPTGPEGSDIFVDAEAGDGGTITINSLAVFGIDFRQQRTPLNDITADSQGGATGSVDVLTLGIDPSRGLAPVPLSFSDAAGLVGQGCAAGDNDRQGELNVVGRGGLPSNPTAPLGSEIDPADWVALDGDGQMEQSQAVIPRSTATADLFSHLLGFEATPCYRTHSAV